MATARKPKTTDEAAALAPVLDRLADGELLAEIAESIGVKRTTLYMQLQATPALVDAYTRAREDGLHARAERLRLLAGEQVERTANGSLDSAAVAQLKLRVDVEKWTLAKLLPKVYGDKLAIGGAEDLGPLKTMPDDALDARIAAILNATGSVSAPKNPPGDGE
jgi:hypothetical protein